MTLESLNDEKFPWDIGIFDAHCHATDVELSFHKVKDMKTRALVVVATRGDDQQLVARYAADMCCESIDDAMNMVLQPTTKIIPSFGWHPWFAHHLYDDTHSALKQPLIDNAKEEHYRSVLRPRSGDDWKSIDMIDPLPLSVFISHTREKLKKYPSALVGEIGLDKAFRLPYAWTPKQWEKRDTSLTPGGREGRRLTRYKICINHQRLILSAQLKLAGEMQRPVSIHGVRAHGMLFETIKETWRHGPKGGNKHMVEDKNGRRGAPRLDTFKDEVETDSAEHTFVPPRICLHSYSGGPTMIAHYIHPSVPIDIFFSFSYVINFCGTAPGNIEATIGAIPDNAILVESDTHEAGKLMENRLEWAVTKICGIKNWTLEEGVFRLRDNWSRFIFGKKGTTVSNRQVGNF